MSSTGQLILKPQHMENQNSNCLRPPFRAPPPAAASKPNGRVTDSKKKKANKKKSGKSGDAFRIQGNTINGGKADRAGIFGFGNKYISRKRQDEEDDSTDEESDSSEDEE